METSNESLDNKYNPHRDMIGIDDSQTRLVKTKVFMFADEIQSLEKISRIKNETLYHCLRPKMHRRHHQTIMEIQLVVTKWGQITRHK